MEPNNKQINPDSGTPMYKQIASVLSRKIEQGELREGERLPSEAELMKRFGVSRITLRSAVDELQERGLLVRAQGKGTFVACKDDIDTRPADVSAGFAHSCALSGRQAAAEVLEVSWVYPTLSDMRFLKVAEDSTILCVKRLQIADDVPAMIETNHYTDRYAFLQEEDLTQPLCDIFEKNGMKTGDAVRTLEVCYADQWEAELLRIRKGDALLLYMERHTDENGTPDYVSKQLYCTERLKFYL